MDLFLKDGSWLLHSKTSQTKPVYCWYKMENKKMPKKQTSSTTEGTQQN